MELIISVNKVLLFILRTPVAYIDISYKNVF